MDAQAAQSLLNFAEGAGPRLRGLEGNALLEQLEQQYRDLQTAMSWFIEQRQANEAFRLASSLVAFWMATKRLDEGSGYERTVATLTEAIGAAAFERARAVGSLMTTPEAVEFALGTRPGPQPSPAA